jgi:hypothetical protein
MHGGPTRKYMQPASQIVEASKITTLPTFFVIHCPRFKCASRKELAGTCACILPYQSESEQ